MFCNDLSLFCSVFLCISNFSATLSGTLINECKDTDVGRVALATCTIPGETTDKKKQSVSICAFGIGGLFKNSDIECQIFSLFDIKTSKP